MNQRFVPLGALEELTLLAVRRCEDQAYGLAVRKALTLAMGASPTIGAVFTTLHRLEGKGMVSRREGEPERTRGGRRKLFYRLTDTGEETLQRADQVRAALAPRGA